MLLSTARASWLPEHGHRLDCQPYLGTAIRARGVLKRLSLRKEPLSRVTSAILNIGRVKRVWVENEQFGVRFLGGSDILASDLSHVSLIAKSAVKENPSLLLRAGTTLITRSGTVGRTAYARAAMNGYACTEDVLRVIPDETKIHSGYLYAYLSGKFGIPLVVSGTYGAIIQHIEPEHVDDLPVPRLEERVEKQVHGLVERAATLLSEYQNLKLSATERFFTATGLRDLTSEDWNSQRSDDLGFTTPFPNPHSFRSLAFSPRFLRICERIRKREHRELGSLCLPGTLRTGPRFKRIDADPEFGTLLIGQKQLFSLKPEGRWIASTTVGNELRLRKGAIAVAAHGTLGDSELYCRSEFISGPWTEFAYTQDILRVIADSEKILPGCLYAFFGSEIAFRMMRSISTGTKLQEPHYYYLPRLPIPFPSRKIQEEIHALVVEAYEKRHQGVALEAEAVRLVETKLQEAAR